MSHGSDDISNARGLRLRMPADLSSSLSDPTGSADAANIFEQNEFSPLGATSALVANGTP